jgi:formate/nitrite transporter FocA (FNT family)
MEETNMAEFANGIIVGAIVSNVIWFIYSLMNMRKKLRT